MRQDDRGADAAADADRVAVLEQVGRPAERTGDVGDRRRPASSSTRSAVLLPIAWMMSVIVPAAASPSAMVSGMRSAPGPRRTMTNWPGRRISAIRGALTTRRVTLGESWSRATTACMRLRSACFVPRCWAIDGRRPIAHRAR